MTTNTRNYERRTNLTRLNAVRIFIVLVIAFGYASTMPIGPGNPELLAHLGHDPSWIGIQLLFFFSGYLALRSLRRHGSSVEYLKSRAVRNLPLLALFTLIIVLVIYPLLGAPIDDPVATAKKLALYFFQTVTCVDPGGVFPGLLDNAIYMWIIQGAIWTFKWGMIAHVGTAIASRIGIFKDNRVILALTVLVLTAHYIAAYVLAKQNPDWIGTPALALRLAYPFLLGMTVYAYQDKLPKTAHIRIIVLTGLIGVGLIWHTYLAWAPAIEMLLTSFWAYALFLVATSRTPKLAWLENWPNLVLGIYLANWPVSQLLLLGIPSLSPLMLIALSLPVSIIIAAIGHGLVSRPINAKALFTSRRKIAV